MSRGEEAGYSFFELLTVLVLVSIFLMLAVPHWQSWLTRSRMTTHVNQIIAAIYFARSEAILRGQIVTLCKSADQKTCSGLWSEGQLVFVDRANTGQVQNPADILRIFDSFSAYGTLVWQGTRRITDYLQIIPYGLVSMQNGTFLYCPKTKDMRYARKISVSPTGRIKVEPSTACHF